VAAPFTERPVVRILVQSKGTTLDRSVLAEIVNTAAEIWRPYADVTFDLADDARVEVEVLGRPVAAELAADVLVDPAHARVRA